MKKFIAAITIGALLTLTGCGKGTSGGPGATTPPSSKPMLGQTEDTFSLAITSTKLDQGETKTVSVGINRGKNFSEDVALKIANLPRGVMLHTQNPVIKHGETDVKLELMATADAALGDFTANVTGHPTKGADATAEAKISVAKIEPKEVVDAAAAALKVKWDEYTATMQTQLDQFSAKYAALKDSAAKSEGQAKVDLDKKAADAKVKLDAASARLGELKSAGADRWDKVKEGVANAFEDLKKILA